jgi:hypothetical protein
MWLKETMRLKEATASARRAFTIIYRSLGIASAERIPMIATTIISSTSENPF